MRSFCSKTAIFINDIYANVTIFRVQLGVYFLDKLLNSFLKGSYFCNMADPDSVGLDKVQNGIFSEFDNCPLELGVLIQNMMDGLCMERVLC